MIEHNSKLRILPEWLAYLECLHPKFIELGLERVNQVKIKLDISPSFPIITVGGTNGKGSICLMLEAILSRAGYRVGCYTSPHLFCYNERVRISQQEVGDVDLCKIFNIVETARINSDISLTYFEFGTLAAMQLFVQASVDIAILEVGLGGRLDAVNIFDADCAVLASIECDHMNYLGDTREKIGFEKAGIFRSGKTAICSAPNTPNSVRQHADSIGAKLMVIGENFGYKAEKTLWNYWDDKKRDYSLPRPALKGVHQLRNASACLAALGAVRDILPVTSSNICQGLQEAVLPGRFQVLPRKPKIILDVAHNPDAVRTLSNNLGDTDCHQKTYAVFAILKDKDIDGVVRELAHKIDTWLVADINSSRGASADEIVQALENAGISKASEAIFTFPDPVSAYVFACKKSTKNDRICVFGSFYVVGEVMQYMNLVNYE